MKIKELKTILNTFNDEDDIAIYDYEFTIREIVNVFHTSNLPRSANLLFKNKKIILLEAGKEIE
jgi:hypothetical protein